MDCERQRALETDSFIKKDSKFREGFEVKSFFAGLLICWVSLFSENVHAQYAYEIFCANGGHVGTAQCRLKPDGFHRWSYGSGYGVAPYEEIDGSFGYSSFDKAVYETLNYLIYSNPNYSYMCNISHSIGATEILDRDKFKDSREKIWTKTLLNYNYGWKTGNGCGSDSGGAVDIFASRSPFCTGATPFEIWLWDIDSYACYSDVPKPLSCDSKGMQGNPILAPSREKIELAHDIADSGPMPLDFRRIYRSHRARDKATWFNGYYQPSINGEMGDGWLHNHEIHLAVAQKSSEAGDSVEQVRVQMGDGTFHNFYRLPAESAYTSTNSLHSLTKFANSGITWVLNNRKNDVAYVFNAEGRIVEQSSRNGWKFTYTYNNGKLSSVQNQFGRRLEFGYNPSGQLASVTSADLRSVAFAYADGLLSSVRQVDGTSYQYLYTAPSSNIPALLRGTVDENGTMFSTFTYDADGWASSTRKAGGVEKYLIPSTTEVIDPLGTYRTYSFANYNSDLILQGVSQPTASLGDVPIYTGSINSAGLVDFHYDYSYQQTTYSWDTNRRIPLATTEATGHPESRTTQYQWHPQWRLPTRITEHGRVTEYTYDERGNRLSETVSGIGGSTRTTSWTYNAQGLVASETAPNGATTSYQYDSYGNLTQSTNALGHADRYTHDAAGRILTHTAPGGLVTTYTYDPRGRMLSANVGGLASTYTYTPSGQLASVQLPGGHAIAYQYDAAQRLTGWSDNRGNSGAYTLDAMGNRTRETLRNAQGQNVWQIARSINSLNRVESTTQAGQTTTYGYDANGDLVSSTNGMGQTTSYGLDALRRVQTLSNAAWASASLSYNALDAVTEARDYKGVTTTYGRDALGNATQETSPDSGSQGTQYDALGLPGSVTDALGRATTIERDLLGRPTRIVHPEGSATTLHYDQAGAGFLSEIQDASGITTYERDGHGRITRKSQTLANGHSRSIAYQYGAGGQLAATTYPDGRTLQYQRDATGQITGLSWAGQAIVQGIAWNPLGQPTGWSWSLGGTASIAASRSYNSAGQVTATEMGSTQYDAAGRIHTLKQKLWRPANTNPQAATLSQATSTWSAGYDSAGRLESLTKTTAANAPPDSAAFEYDANGNLTSSTRERAGTSSTRSYATDSGHNKLLGLEQTTTGATGITSTSTTYQYDAAGNLQSDGLHQYHYDSQGRLQSASTGQGADAPTTRYAHNALGQRVFKTEALYGTSSTLTAEDEEEPGFIQSIANFFARLWSPKLSDAEHLGWAYLYDEEGSLLGEYGMGGASSGGQGQFFYLPTASGPMPIAAEIDGQLYAIHSDHLNTPRHLTQADGQPAWQWAYSAYGDEAPTLGAKRFTDETTKPTTGSTSIAPVRFNLRYPGQYFDEETGLHYNWHRSYDPRTGRYSQPDPIGLEGGWNRFLYAEGNPFSYVDPDGKASLPLIIIGGGMFATGIYKYYDKNKKLEQCAQSCSLQCSSTVACGDPERTEQYSLNRGRCVNTCIPICVAEFIGGPKPGPTKPPKFPWLK